jgi:hypothetical protein
MSTTLMKVANALTQNRYDEMRDQLLQTIKDSYAPHEKRAMVEALLLVEEAEKSGEIPPQTGYGRLNAANTLVKSASIAGNAEFQQEARNAFAAGQLAGELLEEYRQRYAS